MTNRRVDLSDLSFDERETEAVSEVLRTRWISTGEVTAAFEREFAEYVGAKHAVAVTNCTAALHLALLSAGIGEGDEVIVPSLTFVASVNAIRYTGATPVFVDLVSERDWTMSADALAALRTDRTKAIMPVHYAGYPCDMEAITAFACEHGLSVIEDAAHGPGSVCGDRHIGTWGVLGCFSFFANKNMSTGEGGMVVTDDDEHERRVRLTRSHGMTSLSWDRHKGHAFGYDVVALGYNQRFDEMRAAIGRIQLEKLPEGNRIRGERTARYREALAGVPGVTVPFTDRTGTLSHHLMTVLLDAGIDRNALMATLRERGVQTSVHYPPAHLMSIHRELVRDPLPVTESVAVRALTLPLHPRMTPDDVDYVVTQLRACL